VRDSEFSFRQNPSRGSCRPSSRGLGLLLLGSILGLGLALGRCNPAAAQAAPQASPENALPDAPSPAPQTAPESAPQTPLASPALSAAPAPASKKPAKPKEPLSACNVKNSGASMIATCGLRAVTVLGVGETDPRAGLTPVQFKVCTSFKPINWYERFVTGPTVIRFSPEQKLRLAAINLINPFNLVTVVGEAGFEVMIDSHSPYGPGLRGWGYLSGANFTQDMTDQFFGTFAIPSITHTDPHYHRRPDLSIKRRIFHCVSQTFWQSADNGARTLNYSQIVSPVFDIAISNLYVPGIQTHFTADVTQYTLNLATAPLDNFITEFLPSIASRIHTHVVLVQRVIDQVAASQP
jgi:hypothetical protein